MASDAAYPSPYRGHADGDHADRSLTTMLDGALHYGVALVLVLGYQAAVGMLRTLGGRRGLEP